MPGSGREVRPLPPDPSLLTSGFSGSLDAAPVFM